MVDRHTVATLSTHTAVATGAAHVRSPGASATTHRAGQPARLALICLVDDTVSVQILVSIAASTTTRRQTSAAAEVAAAFQPAASPLDASAPAAPRVTRLLGNKRNDRCKQRCKYTERYQATAKYH